MEDKHTGTLGRQFVPWMKVENAELHPELRLSVDSVGGCVPDVRTESSGASSPPGPHP